MRRDCGIFERERTLHHYHQLHQRTAGSTKVRMRCKLGTLSTSVWVLLAISTLLHIAGIVHLVGIHTLSICWLILVSVCTPRSPVPGPRSGCAAGDRSQLRGWTIAGVREHLPFFVYAHAWCVLPGDSEHRWLSHAQAPVPIPWVMVACVNCQIQVQRGTPDTSKCAVRHTILLSLCKSILHRD